MVKGIIFDLDGTLVDTVKDLMTAGNSFFKEMGFKCRLIEGEHEWVAIGGGRNMIRFGLERNRLECSSEQLDKFYPELLKHYEKCLCDNSIIYNGVTKLLRDLQNSGWDLGICTNKPAYLADKLLTELDLRNFFSVLVGGDSFPFRKPDPRALIETMKSMNLQTEQTIFVGDTNTDRKTALAANIPIIMVRFGHGGLFTDLETLKPEAIAEQINQIPVLATELLCK